MRMKGLNNDDVMQSVFMHIHSFIPCLLLAIQSGWGLAMALAAESSLRMPGFPHKGFSISTSSFTTSHS